MNFIQRLKGPAGVLFLAVLLINGVARAQDFGSLSIADVWTYAERRLTNGQYQEALPALLEVLSRTRTSTDDQLKTTAQTCRFEIARIYYQLGDISSGMEYVRDYLANDPRPQERRALGMLAQGFFEIKDWEQIIELYGRLMEYKDLDPDVLFKMNLLAGQAYFQTKQYEKCLEPLRKVERTTEDDRIKGICQIMVARALVELQNWEQLYAWVVKVNRTDRRYDISLNLTLMQGAKKLYEEYEYLNALYLYRMVLPREVLQEFAAKRIEKLEARKVGTNSDLENNQIQGEIDEINQALEVLKDLAPYEQEVTFRIGQIYADVKRYYEGLVLFEKLYVEAPNSEIGDAAALQSVMVFRAVKEFDRSEARILKYLEEKPDGIYARTMLSLLVRDHLVMQHFDRVIELRKYVYSLPLDQTDANERSTQADLHYMLAFAYLQTMEPRLSEEQFSTLLDSYSDSVQAPDALYYRGMSFMLQANYESALKDFERFQAENESNELYPESIFRAGVCLYGLEKIDDSEAQFTRFIENYPNHPVVSEAYSLRGDIEASKESTTADPNPLDRAHADYRKAIDTAVMPLQASYPAFQAAKTYKLELRWQDIINVMNYYLDRWEDMADVAEAIYWIGQAQIELDQLEDEAIPAYVGAIMRFGNDPERQGVDKIISELVNIADRYLSNDAREDLIVQLRVKMANIEDGREVLRLRLQVAMALLEGEDVATGLATRLMDQLEDLSITTPGSLSLMCDVAIDTGDAAQMQRLSDYFIEHFEDSDLLWHAYKARAINCMDQKKYTEVLQAVEAAQGQFGVENFMGWAQLLKAHALFEMKDYELAEKEYNMALNVPAWRGSVAAEAMYGMGECHLALADFTKAHSFFQRTYLQFKAYDNGDWAAKGYLAAADCLMRLNEKEKAVSTLQAMLEDKYTENNPLAEEVRDLLKNIGGQ
ncbi:MAG: tetratricopeptide repeat protein [Pontiellaceae bacterium]|nr:tetratricopeptide repeat protein [Pontiellaceae bacterium]MBN2783739.1 tetratricopeptide repeat protein [Pontiellaceae bacterium]